MTKEERLKGNRLIGEFMGKSFSMSHITDYKGVSDEALPAMKYHSSWHWLMPAWYRFRDIRFENIHHQFQYTDYKNFITHSICYGTLESAFEQIVIAVKWYNSLNLTHEQESY